MKKMTSDLFRIKYNNIAPKQGKILISEPFTPDVFFKRSVVLLTEHTDEGSVGFILNKPSSSTLSKISKEFGNLDVPVYYGGPVEQDSLFYMHILPDLIPNSKKVFDDLYWSGDYKVLSGLVRSGKINQDKTGFFIGHQ